MEYIGTGQALRDGMKNKLSVALLALVITGLTVTAASAHPYHHGGYYGPGFFPSLSFVINTDDSSDNGYVSMAGHVFRKTGDDAYLFTDGNNTYRLDSENSDLPVGPSIVIGGRFDDGQIDIRKWHYTE